MRPWSLSCLSDNALGIRIHEAANMLQEGYWGGKVYSEAGALLVYLVWAAVCFGRFSMVNSCICCADGGAGAPMYYVQRPLRPIDPIFWHQWTWCDQWIHLESSDSRATRSCCMVGAPRQSMCSDKVIRYIIYYLTILQDAAQCACILFCYSHGMISISQYCCTQMGEEGRENKLVKKKRWVLHVLSIYQQSSKHIKLYNKVCVHTRSHNYHCKLILISQCDYLDLMPSWWIGQETTFEQLLNLAYYSAWLYVVQVFSIIIWL